MKNRRLLLSVIIKLLSFVGLVVFLLVLVNSLFLEDEREKYIVTERIPSVKLNVIGMYKGQIKKIRWKKKEVAVLLRQFPNKILIDKNANSISNLHASLNPKTRSINNNFFVYFNTGDSKNCPLYYSGGVLKDTCSLNKFDETGRPLFEKFQTYQLEIPPHYFVGDNVIIGEWSH